MKEGIKLARKMMTKEVTTTTVKIGKIEMVNGTPNVVMLPEEKINGNVALEKAQKLMNKKHGVVTVFEVVPETQVYEMEVMEFIKVASLKSTEKEGN